MLATGGTLAAAIQFLVDRGADDITAICLLAAPEGCARLEKELADLDVPVTVVTAGMDERLNEKGYIVPGLGDAGDRLYGVVGAERRDGSVVKTARASGDQQSSTSTRIPSARSPGLARASRRTLARRSGAVGRPIAVVVVIAHSCPRRTPPESMPSVDGQRALTAVRSLLRVSLASPNSSVVFGSKSSSFSMPAKPGRIERFMNTTCLASSAFRIGMP